MELDLGVDTELELPTDNEIELPIYVRPLPNDDIVTAINSENADNLIIAIGMDPKDKIVVLLTASKKIMLFSYIDNNIPPGPIIVVSGGEKVYMPNINNRWDPQYDGFYADSSWIIQQSKSAMKNATLQIPQQ